MKEVNPLVVGILTGKGMRKDGCDPVRKQDILNGNRTWGLRPWL